MGLFDNIAGKKRPRMKETLTSILTQLLILIFCYSIVELSSIISIHKIVSESITYEATFYAAGFPASSILT